MPSICDIEPAKRLLHAHIGAAVVDLERIKERAQQAIDGLTDMKGMVEREDAPGMRSRVAEVRLLLMFMTNEITRLDEAQKADKAARERMAFSVKMQAANEQQETDEHEEVQP